VAILDDPALGLDPIARKEFNRDLIEHLQAAGRTVLYSSHLLDEVEAVADAVAILHRGRIARHARTDALREEVRQFILPARAARDLAMPTGLLDVRRSGEQLSVIVDGAAPFSEQLATNGIDHDVIELSLDEIFEAFVIGRPQDWPQERAAVAVG
jgi:ABC-2 type transport system ATP-binding protein